MMLLAAPQWTWPAVLAALVAALLCRTTRSPGFWWITVGTSILITVLSVAAAMATAANGAEPTGVDITKPVAAVVAISFMLLLLATPRSKLRRLSVSRLYLVLACTLVAFYAESDWVLCGALAVSLVPSWFDRSSADRKRSVYGLHAVGGLIAFPLGLALITLLPPASGLRAFGAGLFAIGIMIRGGLFPFHLWVRDWFGRGTLSESALLTSPTISAAGVLLLARHDAPSWVMSSIVISAAWTILYTGGLSIVRTNTRLAIAGFSQVAVALVVLSAALPGPLTAAATQSAWIGAVCTITTILLVLRAVESRVGRISLDRHHGLFDQVPLLAIAFLIGGLSLIGFPATIGFVGTELLIESAVRWSPMIAGMVVLGLGLTGVAMMNTYLRLFTGARWRSTVDISARRGERTAIVVLIAMVFAFGIVPGVLLPVLGGLPHRHTPENDEAQHQMLSDAPIDDSVTQTGTMNTTPLTRTGERHDDHAD